MAYQQIFTLQEQRRVHSSQIDWADKTFIGQHELVDIRNIETTYLALFPDTDRYTNMVGGELAIAPFDIFAPPITGRIYWLASKAYDGDYLSVDSADGDGFATDFPDRAEILHIPNDGTGYIVGEPIYFTASDTFTKADYPGARGFLIEVLGGGGGGGGCASTGAGQGAAGAGGGGACYARSWIAVGDLDTTEAITVGAGGAGAAAGANPGSAGNDSVFDTISSEVRAEGGAAGPAGPAIAGGGITTRDSSHAPTGTGDLVIGGRSGGAGHQTAASTGVGGTGGASFLGAGPRNNASNQAGPDATSWGAGGAGANNSPSQGTGKAGGDGAAGLVIVTPYY